MLTELVEYICHHTGLSPQDARSGLGIVLNAAERQGAGLSREIFERVPGSRTLAAKMGDEIGASTGVIARLIEQTPGGRVAVIEQMTEALTSRGLGPAQVSGMFTAIQGFAESEFGIRGFGHLGDALGSPAAHEAHQRVVA